MKLFAAIALALPILLATGCATRDNAPAFVAASLEVDLLERVETTSVELLASTDGLAPDKPIVAATFVDIDDLQASSTLGRLLAEMFAAGLVREGLTVIEVKMRNSLFMEERAGELMLSRDVQRLSASHDAQAILTGTYAQAESSVYVNVRLVRAWDNVILGAASVELPLDRNLRALLPAAW